MKPCGCKKFSEEVCDKCVSIEDIRAVIDAEQRWQG